MRLEKIQVTNFRCVDDSTEFNISDVTCLVGKNEFGKTTLLQAIERLNPQKPDHAEYDRIRDYPRRHLADYEERHNGQAARVVRSVWSVTDAEVAKLERSFGPGCLVSRTVELEKRYEPRLFGALPLDEARVLRNLAQKAQCVPEKSARLTEYKTAKTLHDFLVQLGEGVSASLKELRT